MAWSVPVLCNLAEFHSSGDVTLNNPGNLDTTDGEANCTYVTAPANYESDKARLRGFNPAESTSHFTLGTQLKIEWEEKYANDLPDGARWVVHPNYGVTGSSQSGSIIDSTGWESKSITQTLSAWNLTVAEAQNLFSNNNSYGILIWNTTTSGETSLTSLYVRNVKLSFDGVSEGIVPLPVIL